MSCLEIPTKEDINRIAKAFLADLKSFTVTDDVSKQIKPIICSICDSIPTKAQWSTFVDMKEFIGLCHNGKLRKEDWVKCYTKELRDQYTAKDLGLKDFILSPETYVNTDDEVLVCKQCLSELRLNSDIKKSRRLAPSESIIRGYMIGDAPDVLCTLNPVELSLITKHLHNAKVRFFCW
jgi:hypothetical protein